jgi:hypothetical protein
VQPGDGSQRQWWRLTKGSRAVVCDIWTHPLGGELRCEVDGEMFGTRASRVLSDLLDASDEWRKASEAKGWTVEQTSFHVRNSLAMIDRGMVRSTHIQE